MLPMIYRMSAQSAAVEKSKILRRAAFTNATMGLFALLVCAWVLLRQAKAAVAPDGLLIWLAIWSSLPRINEIYKDVVSSFQKNGKAKGSGLARMTVLETSGFPCELDEYEQLKANILALPGVTFTISSKSWLKSYFVTAVFFWSLLFLLSPATRMSPRQQACQIEVAAVPEKRQEHDRVSTQVGGRRQYLVIAFLGV
jgi:hypothetical protein